MKHINVESSTIFSIAYENGILEIKFLNGSLYQYYHTSKELFENMLNAESKGRFLWRNIRDVYPFKRVA
tara:strand:+ start:284 stop:490 length:207 start_codon:yes stop_codon:yes gene_type:complete